MPERTKQRKPKSTMPEDPSPQPRGYCVVPALVDPPTLARLSAGIDRLVSSRDPAAGVDIRSGTEWIRRLDGTLPDVDQLAGHPRLTAAVEALLGAGAQVAGIRLRNPVGASAHQGLHVDAAGAVLPGQDQLAQVLLFLDDVDSDNGPTRLVPGSHRSGQVPGRDYADPTRRHSAEIAITCRAGDALVFSSHLWHRGTANLSGRPRRAITYAYRRA